MNQIKQISPFFIEYLANKCSGCGEVIQTLVDRRDLEDFLTGKVSTSDSFPNFNSAEKRMIFQKCCQNCWQSHSLE